MRCRKQCRGQHISSADTCEGSTQRRIAKQSALYSPTEYNFFEYRVGDNDEKNARKNQWGLSQWQAKEMQYYPDQGAC